jgi:hypothetical protein
MAGKRVNTARTPDRGPRPHGKNECYVYPDQRPGKHDAMNYLGFVASNGMAYTTPRPYQPDTSNDRDSGMSCPGDCY